MFFTLKNVHFRFHYVKISNCLFYTHIFTFEVKVLAEYKHRYVDVWLNVDLLPTLASCFLQFPLTLLHTYYMMFCLLHYDSLVFERHTNGKDKSLMLCQPQRMLAPTKCLNTFFKSHKFHHSLNLRILKQVQKIHCLGAVQDSLADV